MSVDIDTSYPVQIKNIQSFVTSLQMFGSADADAAPETKHGIAHLSFLLDQSLREWRKEVGLSYEILQQAQTARDARARDTLARPASSMRNLSLVCFQMPSLGVSEARFIHWQVPWKKGRPVSLDHEGRVKALVCVGELREPLDLELASIVHPDCGVAMLRARGYKYQERPAMPKPMMRLQLICDVALKVLSLDGGEDEFILDETGSRSQCMLCHCRVPAAPFPEAILSQGSLYQCPVCLQYLLFELQ